jgi:hypothetical protein
MGSAMEADHASPDLEPFVHATFLQPTFEFGLDPKIVQLLEERLSCLLAHDRLLVVVVVA